MNQPPPADPFDSGDPLSERSCLLLVVAGAAVAATLPAKTEPLEPVTLWPLYQRRVLAPCQYVGFSFAEQPQDQRDMKAAGAEMATTGSMWIPTVDPAARYGCGIPAPPEGHDRLVQRFALDESFTAVIVQFPTHFSWGRVTVTVRSPGGRKEIARRRFTRVPDEYEARLDTGRQPPGEYELELTDAGGTLAVWISRKETPPAWSLFMDGKRRPAEGLEFAHVTLAGKTVWHNRSENHHAVDLARRLPVEELAAAGLKCSYAVGNWNNGGFPYYPDWFYEKFPDITMIDADGARVEAGMFGKQKGWPSIDHPVIVDGTRRHIAAVVKRNRAASNLVYWTLGGEALYPTYLRVGAGWPDYGDNAMAHFHAWLQRKYGSAAKLNAAWGTAFTRLTEAPAPREKAATAQFADWIEFHFAALAERMAWHYAAVRAGDRRRVICTSNHGNIFWSDNLAALGSELSQYADVAEGFEMGQIMRGDDPGYYNLWWASALAGLGKIGAPARLAYKFPDPKARGGGTSYTPAAARRYALEAFGSGWWHLGLIQWSGSLPDGEWGIKGTPALATVSRVFADLKKVRPAAESSWPVLPRVGLYLSRARWILADWDPDWTTFHTWAIQHHLDHALVWEEQVRTGECEPFPVLVSIDNTHVSREALASLRRYVERGGRLVIIGGFASRDEHNQPRPGARHSFLEHQGVVVAGRSLAEALPRLADVLAAAGAEPFCRLRAKNQVSRSLSLDPLTGRHDRADDLSPRHTFGQTFTALGRRLRYVGFRTPTFTNRPAGFAAILRLRAGGPTGTALAEGSVPAEGIGDNAWTGIAVDVPCSPGQRFFLEITPDRPVAAHQLGVWASTGAEYAHGRAYVDGAPQTWDYEFKVTYQLQVPSSAATEAFTLFDGVNFLLPLVNVCQEKAVVEATLDPALLPARPAAYTWYDALTGSRLGPGDSPVTVSLAPTDYRVLSFRKATTKQAAAESTARMARRLNEWEAAGYETDYHRTCLRRARACLASGRYAKVAGYAARFARSPRVKVTGCALTDDGALQVVLQAEWPGGKPFTDAVGVVRALPLPKVYAPLTETAPGRYTATLSAADLVAYDYEKRVYRPYPGPLQVIGNLWHGRSLAQFARWVR